MKKNGTEPGMKCAAENAMMPSMARRPLLTSASKPFAFFSGESFAAMPNGSYRFFHHCAGILREWDSNVHPSSPKS